MSGLSVFLQLLRKDLIVFRKGFVREFIDTIILFFTNVVSFGYLMPTGEKDYTPFFVVGAIASFGFYGIVGKIGKLLADIDGERKIFHTLAMPMTTATAFCYIAISWATTSLIVSALLFPIGKAFAYSRWDLSSFSLWRVVLMLATSNLFFGFFALWLSSVIDGMSNLNSLWRRYIAPIWLFGGYVYSWHTAYAMSPGFAWVSLVNPMLYVMEGMRSAALGPEGYLPFWVCFFVLWVSIIGCGAVAIKKMKAKLDCI